MHDIGRLTFSQLDSYMYMKVTNNDSRLYSPSKMSIPTHYVNAKVKVNQAEKVSFRIEELKREDSLLLFDICDHFWQRMEEVKKALNIPTLEPLLQFLPDEGARKTFTNLISGGNNYQTD